jgi:hypothetical protein
MAGSIGDSGDGAKSCAGRGVANCSTGGPVMMAGLVEGNSLGLISAIADSISASRLSIWAVLEGLLREWPRVESGGLDRELALLFSLYSEPLDDCESDGV